MTKTPDPIQELVTAARRKQILDAATQVFAEKGFHRATIKDIARVAGIADGTIYTYFASKTEVLLGILHRLNESTEREQQLTPESEQDLRSFFTAYLRQRMSLLWPNAEVFQAVLPEMLVNEELRELYYQQVLVPSAAPGTWYIRVYTASVPQPSNFALLATTASVILTGVTPDHAGNGSDAVLTLTGSASSAGSPLAPADQTSARSTS